MAAAAIRPLYGFDDPLVITRPVLRTLVICNGSKSHPGF
jgi:hypothetical protein